MPRGVPVTHPNKQKGNRAELAVAEYLRTAGWPYAERSRAGWTDDRGDIDGIPGIVIEVKDQAKHDLPGWLRELAVETANARADVGVLVVKRRGVPPTPANGTPSCHSTSGPNSPRRRAGDPKPHECNSRAIHWAGT
jgi:hypothetical protein